MSQYQMPQSSYNAPMPQKSNTLKIVLIVMAVVMGLMIIGCGLLAALLFPAIAAARQAAQRQVASNNLRQIGLGFHNYEAAFRRFPALHGVNHEDKPTGNWRIAISPFIEQTAVYQRFNFHKSWDSPENQPLANEMPPLFRSPLADPNQPPNHTNYFTVQDPNSVLPAGAIYKRFTDVTDGLSNTILAIELPHHSIPWMEPIDLTIAEALQLIRASEQPEMIQLLMADGAVISVGQLTDEQLAQMFKMNDGSIVEVQRPY